MTRSHLQIAAALFLVAIFSANLPSVADVPATGPVAGTVVAASDKAALMANIDNTVIITGVCTQAVWSDSGKVMNIKFAGSEQSGFNAVVFDRVRKRLEEAFLGDVAKAWVGGTLRIRGELREYKGNPELTIDDPSQVTVAVLPPGSR